MAVHSTRGLFPLVSRKKRAAPYAVFVVGWWQIAATSLSASANPGCALGLWHTVSLHCLKKEVRGGLFQVYHRAALIAMATKALPNVCLGPDSSMPLDVEAPRWPLPLIFSSTKALLVSQWLGQSNCWGASPAASLDYSKVRRLAATQGMNGKLKFSQSYQTFRQQVITVWIPRTAQAPSHAGCRAPTPLAEQSWEHCPACTLTCIPQNHAKEHGRDWKLTR